VVVLILAVGAYGLFHQLHNPGAYKYKKVDTTYSLKDPAGSSSLSFSRPHELAPYSSGSGRVELQHLTGPNKSQKSAAYISAGISSSPTTLTDADFASLKQSLSSTSNVFYLPSTSSLRTFVVDRLPRGSEVSFGDARAFSNPNIKANAWQIDLNIKYKSKVTKGTSIYMAGKNNFYFFMLLAPAANWQANQAIWGQVLASLKINQ